MREKKIAFVFAWPIRTNPMLITMPFVLNIIELLDNKGHAIEIYLSEYQNDSYDNIFSKNVKIHFLDHNYLWPKEGILSYYFLTTYFRFKCFLKLRNKYDFIFAGGMAGIILGSFLKKVNKNGKLIYMNDEFPIQGKVDIWVREEIKSAQNADYVITPDEFRFEPLCKQIPNLHLKPHYTLPNVPLKEKVATLPFINWHSYFNIDPSKKLFLMAGGLQDFNFIPELIESVKSWPNETILILKGKHDIQGFREKHDNKSILEKIIWSSESFSPEKLHSLIAYCTASLCFYRPINDNLKFVGKSSGKLMRSLLLSKPVIANESKAFNFVTNYNFGILVNGETDIAQGINYILEHEKELIESCQKNFNEICFEKYWIELCNDLGL
jgi:hypothetical protein